MLVTANAECGCANFALLEFDSQSHLQSVEVGAQQMKVVLTVVAEALLLLALVLPTYQALLLLASGHGALNLGPRYVPLYEEGPILEDNYEICMHEQCTVVGEEEACHVEEVTSQLFEGHTLVVLFAQKAIHLVDGHVVLLLERANITQVSLLLEGLHNAITPFVVGGVASITVDEWVALTATMEEAHLAIGLGVGGGLVGGVQVYNLLEAE